MKVEARDLLCRTVAIDLHMIPLVYERRTEIPSQVIRHPAVLSDIPQTNQRYADLSLQVLLPITLRRI